MSLSWLTVLGIAKRIGAWLGSLNIWQLACIGLALFAGIQTLRLGAEQRHSAKVENQLGKAVAELKRISSIKAEQRISTREKIKVVLQKQAEANHEAEKIEHAPLPGQCRTPKEVLDADI
jgi:hypothetical protein